MKLCYNNHSWVLAKAPIFSFYKEAIKFLEAFTLPATFGIPPPLRRALPLHVSLVGYSQVFQALQAGEGFLGHRFDLVSKQGAAVPEHGGRRLTRRKGEEEGGWREGKQDAERSTISAAESDKSVGDGSIGNLNYVEGSRGGLTEAVGWEEGTWPLLFFKDYFYLNWSFATMSFLQL